MKEAKKTEYTRVCTVGVESTQSVRIIVEKISFQRQRYHHRSSMWARCGQKLGNGCIPMHWGVGRSCDAWRHVVVLGTMCTSTRCLCDVSLSQLSTQSP